MANLKAWSKGGGKTASKAALQKLASLAQSEEKPGRLKHPFPPSGEESPYDKKLGHKSLQKRIHDAGTKKIAVDALRSNGQKTVHPSTVAKYIADPDAHGTHQGGHHTVDKPIVVRVNGEDVIYDGHHRATAAWCRGDKDIDARFVDLDGDSKKG